MGIQQNLHRNALNAWASSRESPGSNANTPDSRSASLHPLHHACRRLCLPSTLSRGELPSIQPSMDLIQWFLPLAQLPAPRSPLPVITALPSVRQH